MKKHWGFWILATMLSGASLFARPANACQEELSLRLVEMQTSYRAATAQDFAVALRAHSHPRFLKARSVEDLQALQNEGARLFLNPSHSAGFGVTAQGELISLFNDTGMRGWGAAAIGLARSHGMHFLHCLEPLREYYESFGFHVEARDPEAPIDEERARHWHERGQQVPPRLRMAL